MPSHLLEDEKLILKTSYKVKQITSAYESDSPSAKVKVEEYLDLLLECLKEFKIDEERNNEFDEVVIKNIEKFIPYTKDFIDFMRLVIKYNDPFPWEIFHDFFEKLLQIKYVTNPDKRQNHQFEYDNFHFIAHELVIYFAATLLERNRFSDLSDFVYHRYLVDMGYEQKPVGFGNFYSPIYSFLQLRKQRLQSRQINIQADFINTRCAQLNCFDFNFLIGVDRLLYYLSEFSGDRSWFPILSAYGRAISLPKFTKRLMSKDHAVKFMPLLKVNTIEDFKAKVLEHENTSQRTSHEYWMPQPHVFFNLGELAKYE